MSLFFSYNHSLFQSTPLMRGATVIFRHFMMSE